MTPFAHVTAGYLVTQAVDLINPSLGFNSPEIIIAGIFGANIIDFDVFLVKKPIEHRNTIFHTPIFWIGVFIFLFIIANFLNNQFITKLFLSFSLGIISHLFLDWYAARGKGVGGIRLLYPYSKKHFGLFPLKKVDLSNVKSMISKEFYKFYSENKFLFASEIAIIIFGLITFLNRSFFLFLKIFR